MRPGAFLINIARGGGRRRDGAAAGAPRGADRGRRPGRVHRGAPAAGSPFWDLPNVIVTPHIAGEPAGYAERVVTQVFADNVVRFRAGRPLHNVVDLARGY